MRGFFRRLAPLGARAAFAFGVALHALPAAALEPRFDHREQMGPTVEALYAHDVFWHGATQAANASRGAVRVAWGFDPTGDGDEVFFGGTFAPLQGEDTGADRMLLVLDARYRACVGSDQFKTLFDIGLWGSAADRVAVGPLVGLGFIFDFSRNVGLFATGFLGAGIGEVRVVSFGGGLGLQLRYE